LAFSRVSTSQGRSVITGVIPRHAAQQASLLAGDEIVFADGAPFQPVQSSVVRLAGEVVLGLRRAGALCKYRYAGRYEPNKMFLDG